MRLGRRTALVANLVLALAGIAASVYLTAVHYEAAGGSAERSFCTISPEIDCAKVAASEYSTLVGIPISILGGLFYAWVLVLSLLGLLRGTRGAGDGEVDRFRGSVVLYTFLLSGTAVGYSIFLFYVSHYLVRSFCIFCATLWAVNLGLFAVSALGLGMGPVAALARIREDLSALVARRRRFAAALAAGLVCAGLVAAQAARYEKAKRETLARKLDVFSKAQVLDVPLSGEEPVAGDPDAPHVLIEWLDFRCGVCRLAAGRVERLLAERPGEVKVVSLHLPLDPTCNRHIPRQFHLGACDAAVAAACAQEQGKYWEYAAELFLDPAALAETRAARIEEIARDLDLDIATFQACIGTGRGSGRVKDDVDLGVQVIEALTPSGPDGRKRIVLRTPILLLDGKEVPGVPTVDFWRAVLD